MGPDRALTCGPRRYTRAGHGRVRYDSPRGRLNGPGETPSAPGQQGAGSLSLSAPSPSLRGMATFVLIHGAGDVGWYWHLTEAERQARGHQTVAPDLPCDNDTASLDDYAGSVADAAGGRQDLVIVGQ